MGSQSRGSQHLTVGPEYNRQQNKGLSRLSEYADLGDREIVGVSPTGEPGAEFLPGARFDLSVEVFAPSLPKDLRVTVNGVEVPE